MKNNDLSEILEFRELLTDAGYKLTPLPEGLPANTQLVFVQQEQRPQGTTLIPTNRNLNRNRNFNRTVTLTVTLT